MTNKPCHLEPMAEEHREAVVGIFNHYVADSHAAYSDAPKQLTYFNGIMKLAKRGYCAIMAKNAHGQVIG